MMEIEHDRASGILTVRASGVLTAKDYEAAVPEIEHGLRLAGGPMRVLISLEDFSGWEIGALWRDLRFDFRHANDPGRVAVVGGSAIAEWATRLSAPFFRAEMRTFPREQEAEAVAWLSSAPPEA